MHEVSKTLTQDPIEGVLTRETENQEYGLAVVSEFDSNTLETETNSAKNGDRYKLDTEVVGEFEIARPKIGESNLYQAGIKKGLTPQECADLEGIAKGMPATELAQKNSILPGAMYRRLGRIYRKLGVNSKTAAALWAYENGFKTEENEIQLVEEPVEFNDNQNKVIEHLIKGCTNLEIAQNLDITEHAVECRLKVIYKKIGASNRTEAVHLLSKIGKRAAIDQDIQELIFLREKVSLNVLSVIGRLVAMNYLGAQLAKVDNQPPTLQSDTNSPALQELHRQGVISNEMLATGRISVAALTILVLREKSEDRGIFQDYPNSAIQAVEMEVVEFLDALGYNTKENF